MLVNFFLILLNICILISGYFIIKVKLDNRYINHKIIDEIKIELETIMKNINSQTERNITIIEENEKKLTNLLEKLQANIVHIEHKSAVVEDLIKKSTETCIMLRKENSIFSNNNPITNTYSITKPQTIKQITKEDEEKLIKKRIQATIENMNLSQKITYLQELQWTEKQIKDFLNISSGELELAIEMANSNPR